MAALPGRDLPQELLTEIFYHNIWLSPDAFVGPYFAEEHGGPRIGNILEEDSDIPPASHNVRAVPLNILLSSKTFHDIALPLVYEAVLIRFTWQLNSLVATLRKHPERGRFIRRLNVLTVFDARNPSCIGVLAARTPNVHTFGMCLYADDYRNDPGTPGSRSYRKRQQTQAEIVEQALLHLNPECLVISSRFFTQNSEMMTSSLPLVSARVRAGDG